MSQCTHVVSEATLLVQEVATVRGDQPSLRASAEDRAAGPPVVNLKPASLPAISKCVAGCGCVSKSCDADPDVKDIVKLSDIMKGGTSLSTVHTNVVWSWGSLQPDPAGGVLLLMPMPCIFAPCSHQGVMLCTVSCIAGTAAAF
jgi:hypothetical protein